MKQLFIIKGVSMKLHPKVFLKDEKLILFNIEHFHIQIVPKIGWSVIWLQMKQ
jgi:hypothetical protein